MDTAEKSPGWFIRICRWLKRQRAVFWGSIILGLSLNIFATLLFTPLPWVEGIKNSSKGSIAEWFVHNPVIILLVGIILWLCDLVVVLGSRQFVEPSSREVKRSYLRRIVYDTAVSRLQGIPEGLMAESVQLDEIFISMHLRPNSPRIDYPISEEDLEYYRRCVRSGRYPKDLDRVVLDAEHNWQYLLKQSMVISFADVWQRLTAECPVAVIQGFPGMGKSTLMERLALHMARRGLGQTDFSLPDGKWLQYKLIPILLRLGAYAGSLEKKEGLSLRNYLEQVLDDLHIPGVVLFILKALDDGNCCIMLDGLDEVSDPKIREDVQGAITTFIQEHRNIRGSLYNRFLITTRVAGYDQPAFYKQGASPDYQHYTLAELTDTQIDDFLPRWCRANLRRSHVNSFQSEQEEHAGVEHRIEVLKAAIYGNQSVRELAENPFLLTLLAVMQQNSIELPRQRVTLYSTVTSTLLENRNIAKKLEPIPEILAIQRLGPIAFKMQEQQYSFISEQDVIDVLLTTITSGSLQEREQEAKKFLDRIRERGGLFVQRTGEYFGFMHRTFQEYFAARYILNLINLKPQEETTAFVDRARRLDDLWREPFLIAVAYQSDKDRRVVNEILSSLLNMPWSANVKRREHDLLLAAECIIESKPLTIDPALERQIAEQLLKLYDEAQISRISDMQEKIEDTMQRWLISLPKEAYHPVLPIVIFEAICSIGDVSRQRSTLILLTQIAQRLHPCSPTVFEILIPPVFVNDIGAHPHIK